jgi:EamA domain-containing membrane protein RarD
LLCGLLVFRESIGASRITGFVLIWIGLLVYAANALWRIQAERAVQGGFRARG